MPTQFVFEAIGTHWQIDIYHELSKEQSARTEQQVRDRIALFDVHYSRFRSDSLVSQMAERRGTYRLPEDAEALFSLYHTLYRITGGAFTPLIGQTLSDAGYDAAYSLKAKKIQAPPSWDEALDYSFPTLTVKQPVLLDVGAAGKGYIVDIIGQLLELHGLTNYTVDAGGDMRHRTQNNESLRVGLENPFQTSQAIGVVTLGNKSLCGSSGNRRSWEDFHHILNPHTLRSPKHISALWTVADSTLLADALSTCLFFVPAQKLLKHFRFEYLLLYPDYSIEKSAHFPAELFYQQ